VVDVFTLPFDCEVEAAWLTYRGGTAHLDAIALDSVDATAQEIIADQSPAADILGVKQTISDDCRGVVFKTGDQFKLTADSTDANESGSIRLRVAVRPTWSRPNKTEV
jgi:hypothetical protein